MKYKLLTHTDNHELSRVVNTYLNKGWALYGLPLATKTGADNSTQRPEIEYAQAIIGEGDK